MTAKPRPVREKKKSLEELNARLRNQLSSLTRKLEERSGWKAIDDMHWELRKTSKRKTK